MREVKPSGYLSFTLHAHLPWVVNHGTWPHGTEWLLEAAAETYLPLLRVLGNLQRDGIALKCNLNLSPILLEQLAHPVFRAEFPRYLERKINAAREDESYFASMNEREFIGQAQFWQQFYGEALRDFEALGRDIVAGFRRFHEAGMIEIITCAATHGYLPLLGTDESVRAQVRMAVRTHERHIGSKPRGIWSPECGYRPGCTWAYPVRKADGAEIAPAFDRVGIEEVLSESSLDFFFVDSHLIQQSARIHSPYEALRTSLVAEQHQDMAQAEHRSLYQPYYVDGPYEGDMRAAVTVFPRDPKTGLQVWSGEYGYPGDPAYLDFHKKRWPGGHRYWRVTGPNVNMDEKQPYSAEQAAERVQSHASHFVHLVWEALNASFGDAVPPILSAPFDAELFGHWWFEGTQWLEAVARILHRYPMGVELITGPEYLDRYPRAGFVAMQEGSWGVEGTNHVWLNQDTSWTWTEVYPAELLVRDICSTDLWRTNDAAARIAKQMCRELLLLESSDWQFLITTGAARDYAQLRFATHRDLLEDLKDLWHLVESNGSLDEGQYARLAIIEERDSIFPDIDPAFWAAGAHATRATLPALQETSSNVKPLEEVIATDATASEIPKFVTTDTA